MKTILPFLIILLLVLFGLWFVWTLINLYRQCCVYKYLNGAVNKDKISESPCSFHASVVYMMGIMLRANLEKADFEKVKFMIRYLYEVCPAEYRDEVIEVLDRVTKRYHRESYHEVVSLINRDNLKLNNGQSYFNNERWHEFCSWKNPVYGKEMASELSKYLSEKDRLYLLYLLFSMATVSGNYTEHRKDGGISDNTILKKEIVKGLKLPEEMLTQMVRAWKDGKINDWYHSQFDGGDYPSPEKLADLYPHTANFAFQQRKQIKKPKPESKYLGTIQTFLALTQLLCWFLYFLLFNVDDVMQLIWVSLFLLVQLIPLSRYTYSEILVLPSEVRSSLWTLIRRVFAYACYFSLCWLYLVNFLYFMVNITYERNSVEKDLPVISTLESRGKKYVYLYLNIGKSINDYVAETPVQKPVLPAFSQAVADAVPLLPGVNFHTPKYINKYAYPKIEVGFDEFKKAQSESCNVKLTISIGYYGNVVGHKYIVYRTSDY